MISPFGTLAGNKSPGRDSTSGMGSAAGSKSPSSLGFASVSDSGASPFGTIGAASSVKSPFGAFGDASISTQSNFGTLSWEKSDNTLGTGFGGGSSVSSSGFGIIGTSAFGNSVSSGFGKFGTGFGGAFGGGSGGLTSFAAKGGSDIEGLHKPSKPFGAPASGEDDEDSGSNAENDAEEDFDDTGVKEDKRFHQQEGRWLWLKLLCAPPS